MRRLHLFEFNDSRWCPRFVRDSVVEVLGRVIATGPIPDLVAPVFARFVEQAGIGRILDLGSGTGMTTAAVVAAADKAGAAAEVVLSDLRGCRETGGVAAICNGRCRFWPDPVDAMAVDPAIDHDGRSFFCVFHHFRPAEARRVIAAAVGDGKALLVVEPFPRNPLYLRPLFSPSLAAYLANPFRPGRGRFLKFVFTFIVPLLPFLGLWDGLVSTVRIHSADELMAMAREVGPGWRWEHGSIGFGRWRRVCFFAGFPPGRDGVASPDPG